MSLCLNIDNKRKRILIYALSFAIIYYRQVKRICQWKTKKHLKGGANVEQKTALTIKETAKAFNFPEYAIRTLTKRGAFPVIQVGKRCYIVRQVFEDYIKTGGEKYVASR